MMKCGMNEDGTDPNKMSLDDLVELRKKVGR